MKWLKKLLKREPKEPEEEEEIQIELTRLDQWVEKKLTMGFSKIQASIKEDLKKIDELAERLKEELKELKEAGLRNDKITERERQIMEGNRESYIHQHKIFINKMDIPETLTYKNTSEFCEEFEQLLLQLAKSTGKSHLIMSEFFLKNSKQINKTIKAMSDINSGIKEQMQDYDIDLEANEQLKRLITELKAKTRRQKEIREETETLKTKLSNSRQMKQKIEKQISQLKESESYNEFQRLNSKKEEEWDKLKDAETEINNLFSAINRPMKKFKRIAFDDVNTIQAYLENPVSALTEDAEEKILRILKSLKQAVSENKLSLKEKDLEKYKERIDSITKEKIEKTKDQYLRAKKEIKEIDQKIRNNRALQELNDLNYKMEHATNQVELLNDKLEKNQKDGEKINIGELKEKTEKKLERTFDKKIRII